MNNKPINMSRRGFLRALGVTTMTLSLGGLWVPPKKEVIDLGFFAQGLWVTKPYAAISLDVRMAGIEPQFLAGFQRRSSAQVILE
jgi:hypothetical protein